MGLRSQGTLMTKNTKVIRKVFHSSSNSNRQQLVRSFALQDLVIRYYLQRNATSLQAVKHAASQHRLHNKIVY